MFCPPVPRAGPHESFPPAGGLLAAEDAEKAVRVGRFGRRWPLSAGRRGPGLGEHIPTCDMTDVRSRARSRWESGGERWGVPSGGKAEGKPRKSNVTLCWVGSSPFPEPPLLFLLLINYAVSKPLHSPRRWAETPEDQV